MKSIKVNVNGETITFYVLLSFSFFMVFFPSLSPVGLFADLHILVARIFLFLYSIVSVLFHLIFFLSAVLASSTKKNEEVYTLIVMMTVRKRIFNICARVKKKMRNVGLFLPLSPSLSLSFYLSLLFWIFGKVMHEEKGEEERKKERRKKRENDCTLSRCIEH